MVNPLIVEGQVHGGLAQGIAQALYEEAVYDDDGNLVTSTLADYLVPSAADLPSYVTGRTESRAANRLGVKGVGEAGTIASTPAVVNAIVDALRPLGINDVVMPCTPERVWRAIHDARGGEQASEAEQHAARQSDQTQGNSPQHRRRRGVIPAKFDYVRPGSLDEAVRALAGGGDDAKVIAGGQSLLPLLRLRLAYPELLVDVGGLDELRGVTDAGDALVIGARTTHYQLVHDPLVAEHCGLLAQATGTVADPAIRHRGTLGGALAHADPAGDLPAVVAGPGRHPGRPRPGRRARDRGGGLLRRLPDLQPGAGRDPDRGPDTQARRRLGLPVREVPPDRAVLGHRRRGRAGPAVQRVRRRGQDRADQHGHHAAAGHRRGERRGRRAGQPRRAAGRGGQRGRGHEPAR